MLDQGYTANNFRKLLRPIDFSSARHNLPEDKEALETKLNDAEKYYQGSSLDFLEIQEVVVNGKKAYKAGSFLSDIVLRKLNDSLRRLYRVKQTDRTEVIRQVMEMASDGTPIQFIRRDIKSFYESISRGEVLRRINDGYLLGSESKKILNALFSVNELSDKPGLPRGLGVSSTMSEIFMRQFDREIKDIDGVLFYTRYVDDIIVVSYKNYKKIELEIENKINQSGMSLNKDKSPGALVLPAKSRNICDCNVSCCCELSVEYLGYKLSFPKGPSGWDTKKKGRYVSVSISKGKVNKIKKRIINAFLDFCENSDFELLRKRITYLTSNYPLPLNKYKKSLKGGIYYNYQLINDRNVLRELDDYLRSILYSRNGTLGRKLFPNLSAENRAKLKKYSFVSGFENRFFVNFNSIDLNKISECWSYG